MRSGFIALLIVALFCAVGGAQVTQINEHFNNNALGWTLDIEWQIGPATASSSPGSCGNGDPGLDADSVAGGGVAGVVIGGNASTGVHGFRYLTSPAFDTTGVVGPLMLGFARWLNSDYTPYMQSTVDVFDGTSWQSIFASGGSPGIQDGAWMNFSFDVSAFSNSAFRVRFGFNVGAPGAFTCSGWNIDNVTLSHGSPCMPTGGGGQAPVPGVAFLDINAATLSSCGTSYGVPSLLGGPYFAQASTSGGGLNMTIMGAPNQAIVLLTGALNVGANPIAPYGQLDLGGPGLSGINIVASGLDAGILNSLFSTNALGTMSLNVTVPQNLVGSILNFQAVVLNPALLIQASNAVQLNIVP